MSKAASVGARATKRVAAPGAKDASAFGLARKQERRPEGRLCETSSNDLRGRGPLTGLGYRTSRVRLQHLLHAVIVYG
jgi:hypothetical protein